MSLYSGFATNKYEGFYDKLTFKLLEILSEHAIQTISFPDNYGLCKKVSKIHKALIKLEESRYNGSKESNLSNAFSNLSMVIKDMANNSFEHSNSSMRESKRSNQRMSEYSHHTNKSIFSKPQRGETDMILDLLNQKHHSIQEWPAKKGMSSSKNVMSSK